MWIRGTIQTWTDSCGREGLLRHGLTASKIQACTHRYTCARSVVRSLRERERERQGEKLWDRRYDNAGKEGEKTPDKGGRRGQARWGEHADDSAQGEPFPPLPPSTPFSLSPPLHPECRWAAGRKVVGRQEAGQRQQQQEEEARQGRVPTKAPTS